MLYINRLAVDPKYRNHLIGTTLVTHAIHYAKEKGIKLVMLGTCEFQARGFYEKLGFKVVYERDNNPKGYKSYTMLKRID
jgi:ribosomal protein S18 acetylase RimI-like enzyme